MLYLSFKIKAGQAIQYIVKFGKWQKIEVSVGPLNIKVKKKNLAGFCNICKLKIILGITNKKIFMKVQHPIGYITSSC